MLRPLSAISGKENIIKIILFFLTLSVFAHKNYAQVFDPVNKPIKDTLLFIDELKRFCNFEVDTSKRRYPRLKEKITLFDRLKLHGSTTNCILLEYEYGAGPMVRYPWKYQMLFDSKGRFINAFWAVQIQKVKLFDDGTCLLIAKSTARGNGHHELYAFEKDSLICLLSTKDMCFQTYDGGYNESVYEPNALEFHSIDDNLDGFNDIKLNGKKITSNVLDTWVTETTDTHADDIEFIFLYDPKSNRFISKQKCN